MTLTHVRLVGSDVSRRFRSYRDELGLPTLLERFHDVERVEP